MPRARLNWFLTRVQAMDVSILSVLSLLVLLAAVLYPLPRHGDEHTGKSEQGTKRNWPR